MHAEDSDDFEQIIAQYRGDERLSFLHKGLIGAEWQRAILGVDALLMPYSAPRYRYHWGGMLFTAIGFGKPVVASDDMNPEVFDIKTGNNIVIIFSDEMDADSEGAV